MKLVLIFIAAVVFVVVAILVYSQFHPTRFSWIDSKRAQAVARNGFRKSLVHNYAIQVHSYVKDNNKIPTPITTDPQSISKSGADLCLFLIPKYDARLVSDPNANTQNPGNSTSISDCNSNYDTGISISKSADETTVIVSAPLAELGESISYIQSLGN